MSRPLMPSPRRKFTFAQAEKIRAEYDETHELRPLAARWHCNEATVRGIIKGETYAFPGPLDVEPEPLASLPAAHPIAVYRNEKAKRAERLNASQSIAEAKKDYAALLERERLAGRGGRPKGSGKVKHTYAKPGKPMILAVRSDPKDALLDALGPFGGAA